jgi:AcrR family transcriptional regulator
MSAVDVVRDRILAHGLGVASAQGLQALSVGDLARDLDLSRGGLLAYFATKESLQLGVIEQAAGMFIREVVGAAEADTAGEARVRAYFAKWIAWARSLRLKGGCPFVHASAEGDTLPPVVRQKLGAFLDGWSDAVKAAIEEAKLSGQFRHDVDAEQLMFEMYGLYLSHHFWHWSMKDKSALERTMKAFDRLLMASRPA